MNNPPPKDRKTFIRMMAASAKADFLKDAKQAGYKIEKAWGVFTVRDGEALVFKGVQLHKGIWGITFSTDYWQEAPIPTSTSR